MRWGLAFVRTTVVSLFSLSGPLFLVGSKKNPEETHETLCIDARYCPFRWNRLWRWRRRRGCPRSCTPCPRGGGSTCCGGSSCRRRCCRRRRRGSQPLWWRRSCCCASREEAHGGSVSTRRRRRWRRQERRTPQVAESKEITPGRHSAAPGFPWFCPLSLRAQGL